MEHIEEHTQKKKNQKKKTHKTQHTPTKKPPTNKTPKTNKKTTIGGQGAQWGFFFGGVSAISRLGKRCFPLRKVIFNSRRLGSKIGVAMDSGFRQEEYSARCGASRKKEREGQDSFSY